MLKKSRDAFFSPFTCHFEEWFRVRTKDHDGRPTVDILRPPKLELIVVDNCMVNVIADYSLPKHMEILLVFKLCRVASNKSYLW